MFLEPVQRGIDGGAGGHHHHDSPRPLQSADDGVEVIDNVDPMNRRSSAQPRLGIEIECDNRDVMVDQVVRKIGSHCAKADQADFRTGHDSTTLTEVCTRGEAANTNVDGENATRQRGGVECRRIQADSCRRDEQGR